MDFSVQVQRCIYTTNWIERLNRKYSNAFFVVREKHPITFKVVSEAELTNIDNRILTDQRVIFSGHESKKKYKKYVGQHITM